MSDPNAPQGPPAAPEQTAATGGPAPVFDAGVYGSPTSEPAPQYGQPAPQYGQYAPQAPQYGQPAPQYGQYAPAAATAMSPYPAPAPGWRPPPRAGFIPLQPLTFGQILRACFDAIRHNPKPVFGFALLVNAAVMIISALLSGLGSAFIIARVDRALAADQDAIIAGTILTTVLGVLLLTLVTVAVTALVQGIVSVDIGGGAVGRKRRFSELWAFGRGRFWTLILYTLLIIGATFVLLAIVGGLIALLGLLGVTPASIIAMVLLGLLALTGLSVASAWIGTKLAFAPSAIMLERRGVFDAIRRSWHLTTGRFWKTFGVIYLVNMILSVVMYIVLLPMSLLAPLVVGLIAPTGDATTGIVAAIIMALLSTIVTAVMGAVLMVAVSAAPVVLYLDARIRTEGLDVELQRYVEDASAGVPVPENPYATTRPSAPGPQYAAPAAPSPPAPPQYPAP